MYESKWKKSMAAHRFPCAVPGDAPVLPACNGAGGGGDYTVPGETFLWVVGVIGKTEMVFEYQAYLTGSVEGTLRSDNVKTYYDTNEEAKLTYINYLGNSCTQSVDTPKYPWITYPDGSLVNDKYVEATDDPNEFVLTLEAYAQGEIRNLTKPADIVLVLDAVLAEYEVDAATAAADISAFLNKLHRLEIL